MHHPKRSLLHADTYLLWVEVLGSSFDFRHKGAELDVFVVAEHMDCIFAWLLGPIAHIAGAIALVVTLNLGLRGTLHREACQEHMQNQALAHS